MKAVLSTEHEGGIQNEINIRDEMGNSMFSVRYITIDPTKIQLGFLRRDYKGMGGSRINIPDYLQKLEIFLGHLSRAR